jgi:hypothetical protein
VSTAFDDMLATQPTTRQGAVALIDRFIKNEQDPIDEYSRVARKPPHLFAIDRIGQDQCGAGSRLPRGTKSTVAR